MRKGASRALALAPAAWAIVVGVAACDPGPASAGGTADRGGRAPVRVDSIFPIEEDVRRFQAGLDRPTRLRGASPDARSLVDRLLDALERADTAELAGLAMDRAEFIHLYYPFTRYTAPPYELPPAVVWFQLRNRSSRGLGRLLDRYAGEDLGEVELDCPDPPDREGPNVFWHACVLRRTLEDGVTVRERAFGSIWERDGGYKLVSFSNEY